MKPHQFKVGDRVRIRDWDDMVEEYGIDINGIIMPPKGECFSTRMKHLCGRFATIEEIFSTECGENFRLVDWSDRSGDLLWNFHDYMLELVEKPEIPFPMKLKYNNFKPVFRNKYGDEYSADHFTFADSDYTTSDFLDFACRVRAIEASYRRNLALGKLK